MQVGRFLVTCHTSAPHGLTGVNVDSGPQDLQALVVYLVRSVTASRLDASFIVLLISPPDCLRTSPTLYESCKSTSAHILPSAVDVLLLSQAENQQT